MKRRGNKRKLEKMAKDSAPCPIARSSSYDTKSSPSVYLVKPFARGGGGGGDSRKRIRLRKVLARLYAKHNMSFVPVQSRHGTWIVGVGGDMTEDYGPETIAFDTKTREVITGPKLLATKTNPVLLPVGDRIYALSRNPKVKDEPDFVPWFEVLDISQAQVLDGRLVNCQWEELPRPPCFPWELSPREFKFPPEVTVKSYVAVGSCILVSVTGQTGTYMFNTETEQWAKLDDGDLPFIRGAIPHGPPFFLGLSRASGEIAAYKITVTTTTGCPSLSIKEFRNLGVEKESASSSRFVSLGDHGFCLFSSRRIDRMPGFLHEGEIVTMRAYTEEEDPFTDHWKQVYRICDSSMELLPPLLAAVISV